MSQDEVYLDGKWVKFASLSEAQKNAIIASRRVPDKIPDIYIRNGSGITFTYHWSM